MRPERHYFGTGPLTKPALTGFLAVLMLLAVLFSVSPSLHQTLHASGNANNHFCLVCSLIQGQVDAAEVVIVSIVLALGFLLGGLLSSISTLEAVDYRLSPSRAPPRS